MPAYSFVFIALFPPPAPVSAAHPGPPRTVQPASADGDVLPQKIELGGHDSGVFPYSIRIVKKPPPTSTDKPAAASPQTDGAVVLTFEDFTASAAKVTVENNRVILQGDVCLTLRRPGKSPCRIQADRLEFHPRSHNVRIRGGKMSVRIDPFR